MPLDREPFAPARKTSKVLLLHEDAHRRVAGELAATITENVFKFGRAHRG
jgi:hypothetical protein